MGVEEIKADDMKKGLSFVRWLDEADKAAASLRDDNSSRRDNNIFSFY